MKIHYFFANGHDEIFEGPDQAVIMQTVFDAYNVGIEEFDGKPVTNETELANEGVSWQIL